MNVRLRRPLEVISGRPEDVRLGHPRDVRSERPRDGQMGSLGDILGRGRDVLGTSWGPIFGGWVDNGTYLYWLEEDDQKVKERFLRQELLALNNQFIQ